MGTTPFFFFFFFCSTTFSNGHHFCYFLFGSVYKTRSALKEGLYSSKSEFFLEELTPIEKGSKKGGGGVPAQGVCEDVSNSKYGQKIRVILFFFFNKTAINIFNILILHRVTRNF